MPVGLGDTPEVGQQLACLRDIQHLRQLAGDDSDIRAHPRPERMVRCVHDDAEDLGGDVRGPPMNAVDGPFPLRPVEWLVDGFENRHE